MRNPGNFDSKLVSSILTILNMCVLCSNCTTIQKFLCDFEWTFQLVHVDSKQIKMFWSLSIIYLKLWWKMSIKGNSNKQCQIFLMIINIYNLKTMDCWQSCGKVERLTLHRDTYLIFYQQYESHLFNFPIYMLPNLE